VADRGGHADRAHLARAVALAESVRATTAPNPAVGCVLVGPDGTVVGEGATAPPGGPHAEAAALRTAGPRAQEATAYVTLEPCAHHGRTPPCADALGDAGVARVVYLRDDPNPPARGGATTLRARGLHVDGPAPAGTVLRDAVDGQLEGFLTTVHRGRPHVTLKLAQTVDGRLTAPDGARWITGPTARAAVHRWRAAVDAVLVGSGTVLADDPRLDVRLVTARHQPRPVVLDARLRTPPAAAVVGRGALVVTVAAPPGAPRGAAARRERREALVAAGAEVVDVAAGDAGGVHLPAALAALAEHGITAILAEPGATLAAALLAARTVDRVVLHVGLEVGDGPARPVLPIGPGWRTERLGGAGPDLVWHRVRDDEEAS
jgi:diaminohydroxyphosphoribosylaminopyrimidine deaminase / 5-amino-6-(5-phosphoribosylamino)uracil reductase